MLGEVVVWFSMRKGGKEYIFRVKKEEYDVGRGEGVVF